MARTTRHGAPVKVGAQFWPQHCSMDSLREAWRHADGLGVDSLWVWDHFYPLTGAPEGPHFECYTLLAAMAVETSNASIGALVTCNSYRNPELLADMVRTIDHLSPGRAVLGIGSGWFEKDYTEYGYDFGTAGGRLRDLEAALPRIAARFGKLNPAPTRPIPLLIGGSGEKVTLRIVAERADAWNAFGPPARYAEKNAILDEWCAKVGREPRAIERTVGLLTVDEIDLVDEYLDAGVDHFILGCGDPFDLSHLERLLSLVR